MHRYGDNRGADLRADAGSRALHVHYVRHRDDNRSRRQRHGDRVCGRSLFVDGGLQRAGTTIASGAAGTGAGSVQLNIAGNSGAVRTGTAIIATKTFVLTQAAAPCTFTISPTTIDVPMAGGERLMNVTTRSDCAWTAVSSVPWITVTEGFVGDRQRRQVRCRRERWRCAERWDHYRWSDSDRPAGRGTVHVCLLDGEPDLRRARRLRRRWHRDPVNMQLDRRRVEHWRLARDYGSRGGNGQRGGELFGAH